MRLPVLLAFLPALLLAACGQPGGAVKGDQVRAYLLEHPEVIEEALGKLQAKRQAAADSELGKLLAAYKDRLEADPRDFVAGNPNGAVTVVEFFDYRCPYCKVAAEGVDKLLAENKDVRLVLKEYPVLSAESELAARAALAAKAQGKYWAVHRALMTEQTLDAAGIERILRENGVDMAKAQAAIAAPATDAHIKDVRSLGQETRVSGTPAFLIGDRMISGWSQDQLLDAIKDARKKG